MSDMQKVRVTLTDAEGKRHEVVGWNYGGDSSNGIYAIDVESPAKGNVNAWYIDIDENLVPFTVIQELPTGLGAVVEVSEGEEGEGRWVRYADNSWIDDAGTDTSDAYIKSQSFTVLSKGVK